MTGRCRCKGCAACRKIGAEVQCIRYREDRSSVKVLQRALLRLDGAADFPYYAIGWAQSVIGRELAHQLGLCVSCCDAVHGRENGEPTAARSEEARALVAREMAPAEVRS